MTRPKLLVLSVPAATAVNTTRAENRWAIGAGVGVTNSPYKQYDRDVYPIPVVTYEDSNVWFRDLGGGCYLWSGTTNRLSIMAYYNPTHSKPGDSGSHALRRLDERGSNMMAGLSYIHNTQHGFPRTTLAGNTLDNNNGFIWDLAWLYRYADNGLIPTPGVGVQYSSEGYNDYYYGASNHESRHSGLRSYNTDDGWDPHLELTTSYNSLGNWNVCDTGHYVRLSNEVKGSPMVDKPWSGIFSVGVIYKF